MSLLLETIRLCDGKFDNINYHNMRCRAAIKECFGIISNIDFNEIEIPTQFYSGVFKCRVLYTSIIDNIEFEPYIAKDIKTLKLVECNDIDYHLKYSNRQIFSQLQQKKGECDDIIIVKNGMITDMSYGNLIFKDNHTWFTPSVPLLKGTRRQQLLDNGEIFERDITVKDIHKYEGIKIINAMLPPQNSNFIAINKILI